MPNETWALSRHKDVWVSLKSKLYMGVTGELGTLVKDGLQGHMDRDPATSRMDVPPASPCTVCLVCRACASSLLGFVSPLQPLMLLFL